jgi:hypothetical protein
VPKRADLRLLEHGVRLFEQVWPVGELGGVWRIRTTRGFVFLDFIVDSFQKYMALLKISPPSMPPSSQMIANLKWGVVAFQVKVSTNLGDIAKGIQLSPTKGPVSISLAQLFGGGAADSRLSKV